MGKGSYELLSYSLHRFSFPNQAEFNNTYEEGPDANLRNFKPLYIYDFFQLAQNVV